MDRLAQTALSAIRQMQDNKFDLANNLANVNVPGFRKDLPNEGNAGFLKELEKFQPKSYPWKQIDACFLMSRAVYRILVWKLT
jgi:flagellar basal-body rod protein FlgF